jgi:hypothetical protein
MFTCPIKVREATFQGRTSNGSTGSTAHIFIFDALCCLATEMASDNKCQRLTHGTKGFQTRILQDGIVNDQIRILVCDGRIGILVCDGWCSQNRACNTFWSSGNFFHKEIRVVENNTNGHSPSSIKCVFLFITNRWLVTEICPFQGFGVPLSTPKPWSAPKYTKHTKIARNPRITDYNRTYTQVHKTHNEELFLFSCANGPTTISFKFISCQLAISISFWQDSSGCSTRPSERQQIARDKWSMPGLYQQEEAVHARIQQERGQCRAIPARGGAQLFCPTHLTTPSQLP